MVSRFSITQHAMKLPQRRSTMRCASFRWRSLLAPNYAAHMKLIACHEHSKTKLETCYDGWQCTTIRFWRYWGWTASSAHTAVLGSILQGGLASNHQHFFAANSKLWVATKFSGFQVERKRTYLICCVAACARYFTMLIVYTVVSGFARWRVLTQPRLKGFKRDWTLKNTWIQFNLIWISFRFILNSILFFQLLEGSCQNHIYFKHKHIINDCKSHAILKTCS